MIHHTQEYHIFPSTTYNLRNRMEGQRSHCPTLQWGRVAETIHLWMRPGYVAMHQGTEVYTDTTDTICVTGLREMH